jgi:hypothetical protein
MTKIANNIWARLNMNSFFRELKERKVYRVALGYAVVAWLAVQISATVLPAYHATRLDFADFHHGGCARFSHGARACVGF